MAINKLKSCLGVLSLLSIVSCESRENENIERPNFIVFIADDAAWNDFGAYGNNIIKTPNINKLASEGLVFNNAFLTTSSCSPSRCSILTGLYPHNTGAAELHMPLPANRNLFAGDLQEAGYYTAVAGKYHIGPKREEFDTIYGGQPSGSEFWMEALQNCPDDKPFFLWLAALDPHRKYFSNTIDEPHNPEEVIVPPYLHDNDSTRKDLALYYDEISRLDRNIGLIMEELKTKGLADNTLVIFMSDNGQPFPRAKTRLYDSGIKTPFILHWPSKIGKSKTDALISSIDIAPTFLELAGLEPSDDYEGVSFVPVLEDPATEVREFIAAEHNWHDYQAHERAIRNNQYLYIRNSFPHLNASPPADAVSSITYQEMIKLHAENRLNEQLLDCFVQPRNAEELYDITVDPFQFHNLASEEAYQKVLVKMQNLMDKWIIETNDFVPENPTPDRFDRWTGNKLQ